MNWSLAQLCAAKLGQPLWDLVAAKTKGLGEEASVQIYYCLLKENHFQMFGGFVFVFVFKLKQEIKNERFFIMWIRQNNGAHFQHILPLTK